MCVPYVATGLLENIMARLVVTAAKDFLDVAFERITHTLADLIGPVLSIKTNEINVGIVASENAFELG